MSDSEPKEKEPHLPVVLKVLKAEWNIICAAPWSVVSMAVVSFLAGAGAVAYLYGSFIIPSKDASIQELQIKIQNGNVDSKGEWRSLNEEESEKWISTLSKYKIRAFSIHMSGSKTENLCNSLYRVASNCGAMYPTADTDYTPKGITLMELDSDPAKPALINLLKKYDPNVHVQNQGGNIGIDQRGSGIEIYIGAEVDNR